MSADSDIIKMFEKQDDSDLVYGRGSSGKRGKIMSNVECHYLCGCMQTPEIREEAEEIMTKALRRPNFCKPGDICIISESGTFDKEGMYNVLIKYLRIPESPKATETENA